MRAPLDPGRARTALADRIRRGDQLVGLILKVPNPAVVEVAGLLGYDLVVIDQEHGSGETSALEEHLRAADAVGLDALVRVGSSEPLGILRVLDAGARGVIVPHVRSSSEADGVVRAAHYPPRGIRGLATSTRAGGFSTSELHSHLERARGETVVVVQVEDEDAVDEVAAISGIPGVDVVFLGPADLSLSLGHAGDLGHPAVSTAIDRVVDQVAAADGVRLCVVVETPQDVAHWRRRGASLTLFMTASLQVRALRDALADSRPD